jgi:hypothetical protein
MIWYVANLEKAEWSLEMSGFLSTGAALLLGALLASQATAEEQADTTPIRELLAREYDKSSAPLKLEVIVVEEASAIADWSQGELAGRAFLRRKDGKWRIALCAGDAIKKAGALERLGMQRGQAEALSTKLADAERVFSREVLENIARFDRMVEMDSAGDRVRSDPHHRVPQ